MDYRFGKMGRFYTLNKDKVEEAIKSILDLLAESFEDVIKDWIHDRWPDADELYF